MKNGVYWKDPRGSTTLPPTTAYEHLLAAPGNHSLHLCRIVTYCQKENSYVWNKGTIRSSMFTECLQLNGVHIFFYPYPRTRLVILERGGREGEREGEKHWSVASYVCPNHGPNLHPRYVLWPGTEPATLRFPGQCSNQLSHNSQAGLKGLLRPPEHMEGF